MSDFSYQLYSSRNFPPLSNTFKMLKELGYSGGEGYGGLYADPQSVQDLANALKTSGLSMRSGHFGLDQVENDPNGIIDICATLGIEMVFVPYLDEDSRPADAAGWSALGQKIAALGEPFWAAGLVFGWHNHDFEFQKLPSGEYPMDLLMAADTRLALEFDVAWAVRANVDPMDVIKSYGPRIRAAHVKDVAPHGENPAEDGWADVGRGTMDWPALYLAMQERGTDHFIVEHDNPSDDRRFAQNSLASASAF